MSHHCHGESCDHDHNDLPDSGEQSLLYSRVDHDNVHYLNASEANNGEKLIRPWDQRMGNDKYLESDADEELIIYVPFTGNVKLRSICLRTERSDQAPKCMKVFANRNLDFDDAMAMEPTQSWELVRDSDDVIEYAPRASKFANIHNITLYFPENFGADTSIIRFLGFKGEWTAMARDPIITVYEANANPADHKIPGAENKMDYSIQ